MGKKKKKAKRRRWHAVVDRVGRGTVVGAEVGVYLGVMSHNLFKRIPKLTLYMVDRWAVYSAAERAGAPQTKIARIKERGTWKKIKAAAMKVAKAHRGAKVIKADSVAAAGKIKDGSLDFVFIDGDHSYEGVARDISAWLPKVKPGGWLMGHDYGNKPDGGVKRAVDEFVIALGPVGEPAGALEVDCDHVWAVKL